jgi:hypothetical protein
MSTPPLPQQPATVAPVVVTFRQAEKILTGQEAVGEIVEAANRDTAASPIERAQAMAMMGEVLRQLRRAEEEAETIVLTTPTHAAASRLQSLIASGEAATLGFAPLPSGGLEAQFDTGDWSGWATIAWAKLKNLRPHAMVRPPTALPTPIADSGRVAIVGDWGTGLYGAPEIAKAICADADPFVALVHLGDVYYSGASREMKDRFLDVWPTRPEAVSRGLNSNHDMYSGGASYFRDTLPRFDQDGSYFALQNSHFTLIGLDVAYHDHEIDDIQVQWLEDVLVQAGSRRIVFFSHHQLYSPFDAQGEKLWQHPRFGAILRSKRISAWYWGHEHRCTIFDAPDPQFGLLARCVGHGGMPQSRTKTKTLPRAEGSRFDRADWRTVSPSEHQGNLRPGAIVLEGRNEFIPGEEDRFSPHGYVVLTLDGASLREEVRDPRGQVIFEQRIQF